MKIDSSSKTTPTPLFTEARSLPSAKAALPSNEEVQLSGTAAQLLSGDDDQTFDAARVSEIKQAITEGRFTINAGAIADRLITSARELIASQQNA